MDFEVDRRRGRDDVLIELAFQPFLNDFHVEKTQKADSEPKAERARTFGLE